MSPPISPRELARLTRDYGAINWADPASYYRAKAEAERQDALFNAATDQAYSDTVLHEVGGYVGLIVLVLATVVIGFALAVAF